MFLDISLFPIPIFFFLFFFFYFIFYQNIDTLKFQNGKPIEKRETFSIGHIDRYADIYIYIETHLNLLYVIRKEIRRGGFIEEIDSQRYNPK